MSVVYKPGDRNCIIADGLGKLSHVPDKAQSMLNTTKFFEASVKLTQEITERAGVELPFLGATGAILSGTKMFLTMFEPLGKYKDCFYIDPSTGTKVWSTAKTAKKAKIAAATVASSLALVGTLDKLKLLDLGKAAASIGSAAPCMAWITAVPLPLVVDSFKMTATVSSIVEKSAANKSLKGKILKEEGRANYYETKPEADLKSCFERKKEGFLLQGKFPVLAEFIAREQGKIVKKTMVVTGLPEGKEEKPENLELAEPQTGDSTQNQYILSDDGKYYTDSQSGRKLPTHMYNYRWTYIEDGFGWTPKYETLEEKIERRKGYQVNVDQEGDTGLETMKKHAESKLDAWSLRLKGRSKWWSFAFPSLEVHQADQKCAKWKRRLSYFTKLEKKAESLKQGPSQGKTEKEIKKAEESHNKREAAYKKEINKLNKYYQQRVGALTARLDRWKKLSNASNNPQEFETIKRKKIVRANEKAEAARYDKRKNTIYMILDIAKAVLIGVSITFAIVAIATSLPAFAAVTLSLGALTTVIGLVSLAVENKDLIMALLGFVVSSIGMARVWSDEFTDKPKVQQYAAACA